MLLETTPATRPDLPPMKVVFKPNPNFAHAPGRELLASAASGYEDKNTWSRTRWGVWRRGDAPVQRLETGSFDDAVRAATALVTADRREARWGLFNRHQDRVDAIALLQAGTGWDLVRVDVPVDSYVAPVPGAMAPWQHWTVDPQSSIFGEGDVKRERTDVAAIVGATRLYDLRSTSPSGPTEPA